MPTGFYNRQIEFDQLITPDGEIYHFNSGMDKFTWGNTGYGMARPSYITQRGPFQDGQSVFGFRLEPRVIQLIHRRNECDRDAYWDGRSDLINLLRMNRQPSSQFQTFVLRKILPDNTKRDLNVLYEDGLAFRPSGGSWDEWSVQEPITFIAHDPIFFDPTEILADIPVGDLDDELEFSITFPINFGQDVNISAATITYTGTYKSFPKIILFGPMENPIIKNITTNETIELETTIANGRTVTIDLSFGNKTIEDDNGNNLIGTLTEDSDLGSWHLAPDPEATDGENNIGFSAEGKTAATEVLIRYFTKYIGI
jgi:hypothetical protein